MELVTAGERLGSLPVGLTALSRNACDWRPGWGSQLTVHYVRAERWCVCRFSLYEGRVPYFGFAMFAVCVVP